MSKFVKTQYGNKYEILKYPKHYIAVAVTVDATGVSAGADGKKIVPAGTVIGGSRKSVLENLDEKAVKGYVAAKKATLTTGSVENDNAIVWTAVDKGIEGNTISITIAKADTAESALGVAVAGNDITVTLGTDEENAAISTAAEVAEKINTDDDAGALVVADASGNPNNEAVVAAKTKTQLAGGADSIPGIIEGVLLNDVDVTYGDAPGAMLIHGFVDINKMPEEPDNDVRSSLPQITFIK